MFGECIYIYVLSVARSRDKAARICYSELVQDNTRLCGREVLLACVLSLIKASKHNLSTCLER